MQRKELYNYDEVKDYLKGGTFFNYSQYFKPVSLFTNKDGKLELRDFKSILNKGEGLESRRKTIRSYGLGVDYYFELAPDKRNAKVRKDLGLGRTIINIDDDGVCTIEDKRYFVMYPGELPLDISKKLKKLDLTKVYVKEEDNSYSIEFFDNKSEINLDAKLGYLLPASELSKILENDKSLLSEPYFEAFIQNGDNIRKVALEDALDTTITYHTSDEIGISLPSLSADKIETFYEYDPFEETKPAFGDTYELTRVGTNDNGEVIWRKNSKIIQNESDIDYAIRAFENGSRTVVRIPDGKKGEEIINALTLEDKIGQVKEYTVYRDLSSDYLVERQMDKKLVGNSELRRY